jgi:hypothetical protein
MRQIVFDFLMSLLLSLLLSLRWRIHCHPTAQSDNFWETFYGPLRYGNVFQPLKPSVEVRPQGDSSKEE